MLKIITKFVRTEHFAPSELDIKLLLNLPAKKRFEFKVVIKRLAKSGVPLFPMLGTILHSRKGNKISRVFRHVFENRKIQRVLGLNLATLFLSTSLMQFPFNETTATNEDFVIKAPFVLETKKNIQYPVETVKITQKYSLFHPGLDLDGITGDQIRPIIDGTVEAVNYSKYAYGNAILINHGENITSLYAHLSKIFVKPNQEVFTDTIIGEMGATGHASGDHLHLEIRDNGKTFNPLTILPK